jgi:nitrite reductase/ring-hydroxylating ferredoxin subunit
MSPRELPEGGSRSVRVGGRRIALFREGGALYAVDEACPHMRADLSNGTLRDGILTCAWHGWQFDLRGRRGLTREWACPAIHLLRVEGEQLVVELASSPPGEADSAPQGPDPDRQ